MFFKKKEPDVTRLIQAMREAKKSKEQYDNLVIQVREKEKQLDILINKLRNILERVTDKN